MTRTQKRSVIAAFVVAAMAALTLTLAPAALAAPKKPPTVSVSAPTVGQVVSGTAVTLNAATSTGPSNAASTVAYLVDGVQVASVTGCCNWAATWSSTGVTDGAHSVVAKASNSAGTTTSAAVSFSVQNTATATTANLTLTPGDTTIRADWSLNVGTDGANGAILSRDGNSTDQTTSGWTSPNYVATSGTLTFTALYDGQPYNITVQPTVNGVAVGTPTTRQATPAAVTPPPPPPGGQFTATSTGQILDSNGAVWRGKGLGVVDWQSVPEGAALAQKMLSSPYFPGTRFVRIAAYSYDTGDQLAPFVNAMAQAGVLVVIEHHDGYSSNYTGQALTDESNWYASLAGYFKTNAYVGFGSMNEPGGNDTAQMVSTYNAIRGAGDSNIIFMEAGNGANGEPNSLTPSSFATMHNVGWDIHGYNWESNYSTSTSVITTDMNNRIAGMGAIPSADGTMPVICAETGNSTNGSTIDPGGSQELQATYGNANLLAVGAWIWSQGNTTNIDNLTQNEGPLTPMGTQVQGLISATP